MGLERRRKAILLILLLIVVFALLLRVFNVGHVLSYDEAWNVNSMVDVATGNTDDAFYNNFLRHPPAYSGLGAFFAIVTGSGRHGLATAMEIVSILFSLGLVVMVFMCGRDFFDARAGLIAAFLFAVLPSARVYDSWIKQESMTLFLSLLFLMLFFRKKYLVAGVVLGLATLTKEIFVFVPAALLLFLALLGGRELWKGFLKSAGTAIVMSFWWYLFVSKSGGEFLDFFLGRGAEAVNWGQPWYYYLRRLPSDLGWPILVLAAMGVALMVYRFRSLGWVNRRDGGFRKREMALLVVIWVIAVYLPVSVSVGKPPWMVYSALPAFALLAGFGLDGLVSCVERSPAFGAICVVLVIAVVAALAVGVSFGDFVSKADPTFDTSLAVEQAADYINDRSDPDATLMLRINDLSPTLAYYVDLYRPGGIALLDEATTEKVDPDYPLMVLDRYTGLEQVAVNILVQQPDFLFVRPGYRFVEGEKDLAAGLSRLAQPVEFNGIWVFDGRELYESIAELHPL